MPKKKRSGKWVNELRKMVPGDTISVDPLDRACVYMAAGRMKITLRSVLDRESGKVVFTMKRRRGVNKYGIAA